MFSSLPAPIISIALPSGQFFSHMKVILFFLVGAVVDRDYLRKLEWTHHTRRGSGLHEFHTLPQMDIVNANSSLKLPVAPSSSSSCCCGVLMRSIYLRKTCILIRNPRSSSLKLQAAPSSSWFSMASFSVSLYFVRSLRYQPPPPPTGHTAVWCSGRQLTWRNHQFL